jgi:hypothetical protein
MKEPKIIILAGESVISTWAYNYLTTFVKIEKVIIENKEDKTLFIRRRINRLGFRLVFGQVLFSFFILFVNFFSRKRRCDIFSHYRFKSDEIPKNLIEKVISVNDSKTLDLLNNYKPDIVLVFGTRIISSKIINSIEALFVNIHAGITPKYRGVHGAYWALINGDLKNCGVTLHYIDKGIDTGGIISQKCIFPTSKDNFTTYPLLQLGEGLTLLKIFLENYKVGKQQSFSENLISESRLWYHPTLWFYVRNYLTNGIK